MTTTQQTRTSNPQPLQVADFNSDGRLDFYFGFEMLFATGGGAYQAMSNPSLYPSAGVVKDVAWGDVNGDGLLDLIIARTVSSSSRTLPRARPSCANYLTC